MQTVILRNGAEEVAALVMVAMMMLREMKEEAPVTFYEFVCKCRDPKHEMWGDTERILAHYAVLDPAGGIHDSIRNVVLSAVEGEDFAMYIRPPVDDEAPA